VFTGTELAVDILLNKSGEAGKPITYSADQDEAPVLDFYELKTPARIKGISVTGSWLHLKGMEIRGVQQILTNTNKSRANLSIERQTLRAKQHFKGCGAGSESV
jgi:hypothetical protein